MGAQNAEAVGNRIEPRLQMRACGPSAAMPLAAAAIPTATCWRALPLLRFALLVSARHFSTLKKLRFRPFTCDNTIDIERDGLTELRVDVEPTRCGNRYELFFQH